MNNLAQAPSQRRAAIQQFLNDAIQHVCQDTSTARQATIGALLESLRAFGEKQLTFFESIYASPAGAQVAKSQPKEYVMNAIIEQMGFDLDVILRAYSQRRIPLATKSSSHLAACSLSIADLWAYSALAPVMRGQASADNVLVEESTILTYLQKAPYVRLIPYAPVVLIGLPFSAIGTVYDLMALPHEVGHYIYQRGLYAGESLEAWLTERLQNKIPQWGMHWLEEIFADVYGCLVAGTHFADSGLELASRANVQEFFDDNGEHPMPAVRPLVYITVLTQLGERYAEHATQVRAGWLELLRNRNQSISATDEPRPLRVLTENGSHTTLVASDQATIEEVLNTIIAEVLALPPLQSLHEHTAPTDSHLWGRATDSLAELTAQLHRHKEHFVAPELTLDEQQNLSICRNGQDLSPCRAIGQTPWDDLRIELETTLQQPEPEVAIIEQALLQALNFSGWAVKVIGGIKTQPTESRPQTRGVKPKVGGVKTHVGGVKTHVGKNKTQSRGVKPNVGGVKTHVGGVKTHVGGVKTHTKPKK